MSSVSDGTPAIAGASRAGVIPIDRHGPQRSRLRPAGTRQGQGGSPFARPYRPSQRSHRRHVRCGRVPAVTGRFPQQPPSDSRKGYAAGRRPCRPPPAPSNPVPDPAGLFPRTPDIFRPALALLCRCPVEEKSMGTRLHRAAGGADAFFDVRSGQGHGGRPLQDQVCPADPKAP